MEYLSGGSLRDRLSNEKQLGIEESVRIAESVLKGLAALHATETIHRDVTPGNILFGADGAVKLGDFGVVRREGRDETQLTREGGMVGTLGYLSPEQVQNRDLGPRSDLYSLGVVLFEMLAGRLPQEAISELGRRLAPLQAAPDVRRFRKDTPRWIARIVSRLLEVRPADRYQSAKAVLRDFERHHAPGRPRLRRRLLWSALAAFLLLAAVVILVPRGPSFSHLVPLGSTGIAGIGTHGERLWTIPWVNPDTANRAALARLTPDGPRLLATVLARPEEWSPEAISTLSYLDPATGKVVKKVPLPTGEDRFPNDPPRFWFSSIKAVDLFHDGRDEVFVGYSHVPEAPSYTVLYEPRFDRSRIVYYSQGGQSFQGATDLDGDGTPELLFAGIDNGWNWVNVVSAVKLIPWPWGKIPWTPAPVAAPDASQQASEDRYLLWYAIVPRGHFDGVSFLDIDEARRELTLRYETGKTWTLGFDGFLKDGSSASLHAERETARRETYDHFREAERLRRAGALDSAMSEARAAFKSAQHARDLWLAQYAERIEAKILVSEGRIADAEALFTSLMNRAEDVPEVAYDAAVAFHLHGDLSRAVAWYERGIGRDSAMGAGKSKHEFLKGEVLALVEERRYTEALEAVERFGATYPSFQRHIWLFREYVRWRAGERPELDPAGVPWNWTDLERYWALEFALATDDDPSEILRRVDRYLTERPETRAEVLSLRAELLARLGYPREAAEAARAALELVQGERYRSIIARGHADLVEERAQRLRISLRGTVPRDRVPPS